MVVANMPGLGKDYGLVFTSRAERAIFATVDGEHVSALKKDSNNFFENLYFDAPNKALCSVEPEAELYYSQGNQLFGLKKGVIKKFPADIKGIARFKTRLLVGQEHNNILCAEDNSAIVDEEYSRRSLVKVGGNLYSLSLNSIKNCSNGAVVYDEKEDFIPGFVSLEGKLYFVLSEYNSEEQASIRVYDGEQVSGINSLLFKPYSLGAVSDNSSGGVLLFAKKEGGVAGYKLEYGCRGSRLLEESGIPKITSITQVPMDFLKPFLN